MSGSSVVGTSQPESGVSSSGDAPAPQPEVSPSAVPAGERPPGAEPPAVGVTTEPPVPVTSPAPEIAPEASTAEPAPAALPLIATPKPNHDPTPREVRLTHASRILVIAALLGGALSFWAQLAFRSPWLDTFLTDNTLEPGQRNVLILALVLGTLAGGLAGIGVIVWQQRRRQPLALVEQWAWFLCPLLMLPVVPVVFRAKVWQGRHEVLLPALVLLVLVFEQLVHRSLANVPAQVVAYFNEVRSQVPRKLRERGPLVIVIAAAAAYAAFFIFYTLRWHYKLRTGNYDLSINNNLMFGGLEGHFLESTVVFPKDPPRYLANHAKFGAYLFLPIYALFPRAETLLVIQSLFVGFGAVPLFAFARRHLSDWMAALVALAYLSYYPLHGASFSEFQAIPVAAFFVFTVAWATETGRYRVLAAALLIALLLREDVSIGLAVLGAFFLLSGYRPLPGLVIAAVAGSYFLLLRFYVMDSAGSWWFPNMYKELWADEEKGFRSVIKTMITNPTFTLSKLIVEKKLYYMLHLLLPLAFLPVRRWYLWLAFLPGVLLTLLVTNYDPPITYSFHYVMHWAPYLFMAAAVALEAYRREAGVPRYRAAAAAMLAATIVLSYNYGAFPRREGSFKAGFSRIEFSYTETEAARYQRLKDLVSVIPPDAPVAATEKVGPHVSSRRLMYTMRNGPQTADWIVASSRELKLSKTRPMLKEALESGTFGVVRRSGDFALMKRGHATDENAKLILDWEL
jgi:uncharacterized membrane protein